MRVNGKGCPNAYFVLLPKSLGMYLCTVMSLAVTLTPSGRALVGNPIKLTIATDGIAVYTVIVDGTPAYTGSGQGAFYVFLSEIILPYLSAQLCSNENGNAVIPISGQYANVMVSVSDDDGNGPVVKSLMVYLGGISRRAFRALGGNNIFTARFMAATNFFFTARGTASLITMKEREIMPLPMIVPEALQVVCGSHSYSPSAVAGTFAALNLSRLRAYWQTTFGYLPDHFDIYGYHAKAVTIRFEASPLSKDSYLVRFLDSLGCYCLTEFRGGASQGVDMGDDVSYQKYDAVTDSYAEGRNRLEVHPVVKMSTGYQTEAELLFLQELLQSEDVTLLSFRGADRKVTATCDSFEVALASFSPGSLDFDFRFVDADITLD